MGYDIFLQLLQDHYDLRALREEQQARERRAPAAGTDGITRTRLETGHAGHLATLSGKVAATRCAWRKPGAPDYLPADAALSTPAGGPSGALAKLAALEAARSSFESARDAIARRCGPVTGKRQIEDSVVYSAADITAFCAAWAPEPCPLGHARAVSRLQGDRDAARGAAGGHHVGRREAGEDADPADGRGETERKRMAALVTVYDAEPARVTDRRRSTARRLIPGMEKIVLTWWLAAVRCGGRRRVERVDTPCA